MTQPDGFGDAVYNQAVELWINPEIERRRAEGTWDDALILRSALVLFPADYGPVVQFNDEVGLMAVARSARAFAAGEQLRVGDIREIVKVQTPTHNGVAVGYLLVHWQAEGISITFNFLPGDTSEEGSGERLLLLQVQKQWQNQILRLFGSQEKELEAVGLWAAPALFPFPLNRIAQLVRDGQPDDARTLLVSHCTTDFLSELIGGWKSVAAFEVRGTAFQQALEAHRAGLFAASIRALVPDVEGVITDWLYEVHPDPADVPYREISKAKRFRELIESAAHASSDGGIRASLGKFIVEGPVYATFEWAEPLGLVFPGRNPTAHGRFDPLVYTEENSIKCFLLLDSIHKAMVAHSGPAAAGGPPST